MEYRIREYRDEFIIQCQVEESYGTWFNKKTRLIWKECDAFGKPVRNTKYVSTSTATYKNLEDATRVAKQFKVGFIYHEL